MKVRIKSFNGELPEYLTEGKVYEDMGYCVGGDFFFKVDDGNVIPVGSFQNCRHLNGGSWVIVYEDN